MCVCFYCVIYLTNRSCQINGILSKQGSPRKESSPTELGCLNGTELEGMPAVPDVTRSKGHGKKTEQQECGIDEPRQKPRGGEDPPVGRVISTMVVLGNVVGRGLG